LLNYSFHSNQDDEGSKRKLSAVFKVIEKMGHDVDLLWEKIDKMVTLTLIAVAGELKVELQGAIPPGKLGPTCFQFRRSFRRKDFYSQVQTCIAVGDDSREGEGRRKRTRRKLREGEEEMDVDTADSRSRHRRHRRREKAISIKFNDEDEGGDSKKSIFDESPKNKRRTEDEDDQNVDAPHETSENSQEESSEEEYEEEESCLREIFPAVFGKSFEDERILEKIADIFISCLGVKGSMRMGPTMFRLFARKCRLNKRGITNAAIDILYIDMQRKFEYLNPDRTAGVCFFAFAGGCVRLASLFNGSSLTSQLRNFLEHCQTFMRIPSEWEAEAVLKARQRFSQRAREGMFEDGTEEIYELSFKGERSKTQVPDDWPTLLEEKYTDRTFSNPQKKHTSIFSLLQSLRRLPGWTRTPLGGMAYNRVRFRTTVAAQCYGLCFLGFVSACYEIARQLFYSTSKSQMLRSVIDYCSQNLRDSQSAGSLQRRKKKYDPSQWRESSPQTESRKGPTQKPVRFTTIRQLTSLDELTSFLKKDNLNMRRTRTLYGYMAD
uniref:Uncharacterized protein n=1 Tax=Biomphalaria glabrata TaxID=6526 RepID=A0A2C9KFJ2_BIOGL